MSETTTAFNEFLATTHSIPHGRSTSHVHSSIVGPLLVVEDRAISLIRGAIKKAIVWGNEAHGQLPLPDLLGPIRVELVAEIFMKACGDVEEATIRYGILVIVSLVEKENLPPQPTSTRLLIPSILLGVEHCLGKRQPRRLPLPISGSLFSAADMAAMPKTLGRRSRAIWSDSEA